MVSWGNNNSFFIRIHLLFCIVGIVASYSVKGKTANDIFLPDIKTDSLENIIKTAKHDTLVAASYVALAELYTSNIDTVTPLCLKAIEIADKVLPTADKKVKRALLVTKSNALNNIGYVYKQQGNYEKALEWYEKSLRIRERVEDKKGIAASYNNIGMIYNSRGNIGKAMEYYQNGLKLQTEINDLQGIATSANNIGFIYYNQADIPKAIDWYAKSLRIREEIGDKKGLTVSYINLGNVYNNQGDFPKALQYYNKSLKTSESIGNKKSYALALGTLGDLYKNQAVAFFEGSAKTDYLTRAFEFYDKGLKIYEELGDKEGIARILNNVAFIYEKQGETETNTDSAKAKYSKTLELLQKCELLWSEIGNKEGIANSQYNLSGIYLKQALANEDANVMPLLNEAEKYGRASLKAAKELNYPEYIRNAGERLSTIYRKMGEKAYISGNSDLASQKYKEALAMQDLLKLTQDKINNVEAQKRALKQQMKLEFQRQESEAKALQAIKDKGVQKEKQLQFVYLIIIIFVLVIVIVFSLILFNGYRQKQALNMELEKLSIVASETDNGVIICSADGTLEWINPGMQRLLGYNLDEWKERGSRLQEISYNPQIVEKVNHSIETKQTVSYESLNYTKDGRKIWVHSTLTPILDKNKVVKKLVVIDTDITERKKTENIINNKNQEITDSIHAAKRIQHALLTSDLFLKKHLPEYFVLYKPKDIVSGDFYWAHTVDNKLIMVTGDCTGHGVPGAMMSLLNITYLNEAIIEKEITSPEKILDYVRSRIISSLNPEHSDFESKEGMDAVLCVFDFKGLWLRFACANNPLWIVRKNEVIKYKPDKMPVGMHYGEQKPFTAHTIGLRKGDTVYMFTDGYADQFGGPNEEKFKYEPLKQLLLSIQDKSMAEQKTVLETTFKRWKGHLEQIDDVLVIGVRL